MKALLCASNKRGLLALARGLSELQWELYATDGTHGELAGAGVATKGVADLAGAPTLLGGRLKTLHASIFAGLLYRRGHPEDEGEVARHGFAAIDLLACNFYSLPNGGAATDLLPSIDIGGPAMVRAAAKNFPAVIVLVDPDDYPVVLRSLSDAGGDPTGVDGDARHRLAAKAFAATRDYDEMILERLQPGRR